MSRIEREIPRLYDNELRVFEISSLDYVFRNFTERNTIEGVSEVDVTSFLKMAKKSVVGKLQEKGNIKFRIVLVSLIEKSKRKKFNRKGP